MRTDSGNKWEYGNGSKDAARLSLLMANTGASGDSSTRSSIPLPPLEREGEAKWDARGAMTLEGYQRLRRGYERGINPEALERMEEHEGTRQFPAAAPPYNVPVRTEQEDVHTHAGAEYGEAYEGAATQYNAHRQADYPQHRLVYGDDPVDAAAPMIEPHENDTVRRPRRMGPIAVTLVLLIGIVGALLLYGGGVEYIADLFRGEKPVVDENLTLITERPGAEPEIDPSGALAPGEEMEMSGESETVVAEAEEMNAIQEGTATSADLSVQAATDAEKDREEERALAAKAAAEKAQREQLAEQKAQRAKEEAKKAAEKKAQTKPTATAQAPAVQTTRPTVKPVSTSKTTTAKPQGSATKAFTVQVRATPNKEEADRVARSLRAKGGADVHVVASEKDGETMYRVRFGSFGSAEEGKAKAGEMGYANVWVIKR